MNKQHKAELTGLTARKSTRISTLIFSIVAKPVRLCWKVRSKKPYRVRTLYLPNGECTVEIRRGIFNSPCTTEIMPLWGLEQN